MSMTHWVMIQVALVLLGYYANDALMINISTLLSEEELETKLSRRPGIPATLP